MYSSRESSNGRGCVAVGLGGEDDRGQRERKRGGEREREKYRMCSTLGPSSCPPGSLPVLPHWTSNSGAYHTAVTVVYTVVYTP